MDASGSPRPSCCCSSPGRSVSTISERTPSPMTKRGPRSTLGGPCRNSSTRPGNSTPRRSCIRSCSGSSRRSRSRRSASGSCRPSAACSRWRSCYSGCRGPASPGGRRSSPEPWPPAPGPRSTRRRERGSTPSTHWWPRSGSSVCCAFSGTVAAAPGGAGPCSWARWSSTGWSSSAPRCCSRRSQWGGGGESPGAGNDREPSASAPLADGGFRGRLRAQCRDHAAPAGRDFRAPLRVPVARVLRR